MDYQRIIVIGNTTQDAEVKTSEKGEYVLLFVASKTRSGQTIFFPVFAAGRLSAFAKEIKKGAPLFIDGTLEQTEYEPEGGEKRKELRIYADTIRRLGGRTAGPEDVKEVLGAEEVEEEKEE